MKTWIEKCIRMVSVPLVLEKEVGELKGRILWLKNWIERYIRIVSVALMIERVVGGIKEEFYRVERVCGGLSAEDVGEKEGEWNWMEFG